jgi:dynein heavy chain
MHESSLFNIITNIQFFKSYAITKLFNIWKANVRYRCFCKTRKKLVYDALIAKPAFAEHLVSLNRSFYDLQNNKTIAKISDNTAWDK